MANEMYVDKCKVMHIGKNNPNYIYNMMGTNLATTTRERDLGDIVDSSLKTSTQCAAAVEKANRMLGIIKKGIENKTKNILLLLYKSMVCPHLEYCVQMWPPHLKKDILALEKVQKRQQKLLGFWNECHKTDWDCNFATTIQERDLGIIVDSFLKTST